MKSFNFSLFFCKLPIFWNRYAFNAELMTTLLFFLSNSVLGHIYSYIQFHLNGHKDPKIQKKIQKKKYNEKRKQIYSLYFSTAEKGISRYNAFVCCLLLISIGKSEIRIPGGTFSILTILTFQQLPKYIFKHIVPHRSSLAINFIHQNVHKFQCHHGLFRKHQLVHGSEHWTSRFL